MSLELPFGIRPVVPLSNVDERYGPYQSVEDALIGTQGTRVIGLTVGVIENGIVVEYWFRSGISDEDLTLKVVGGKEQQSTPTYTHISLTNYSPNEDIMPAEGEVRVGDMIWKTKNETWNDGGDDIYYPNGDPLNESDYGLLYTAEATERLLADNPGYRLPTTHDMLKFLDYLEILNETTAQYSLIANKISSDDNDLWWHENDATNELGLGFVPAGYARINNGELSYTLFKVYSSFWVNNGEYFYADTIALFIANSLILSIGKPGYIWPPNSDNRNGAHTVRLIKDI